MRRASPAANMLLLAKGDRRVCGGNSMVDGTRVQEDLRTKARKCPDSWDDGGGSADRGEAEEGDERASNCGWGEGGAGTVSSDDQEEARRGEVVNWSCVLT
jgi:hypothetical protein